MPYADRTWELGGFTGGADVVASVQPWTKSCIDTETGVFLWGKRPAVSGLA
jgi:hypothetical protein